MKKGYQKHILITFALLSIYFGLVGCCVANNWYLTQHSFSKIDVILYKSFLLIGLKPSTYGIMASLVGVCIVWIFWTYWYFQYRPEREGEEHGSATFGTIKEAKKFASVDEKDNILLSQNIKMGFGKSVVKNEDEARKYERNKNVCVIGASGSGKTRYYVTPNVMQLSTDMFITDPKGGVLSQCGHMLANAGYRIKSFNTFNPSQSCHYNPLRYVRTDGEVLEFANFIIKNSKGKGGGKSSDPYWDDSANKLYSALIPYLRDWCLPSDYTLPKLVHLLSQAKCKEEDEDFQSPLDKLYAELKFGLRETFNEKEDNDNDIKPFGIEFVSINEKMAESCNHEPLPLKHEILDNQGNVERVIFPYHIYLEQNFGHAADVYIEKQKQQFWLTNGLTLKSERAKERSWQNYLNVLNSNAEEMNTGEYRFFIMERIAQEHRFPHPDDNPNITPVFNDNGECEVPLYDEHDMPIYKTDNDGKVVMCYDEEFGRDFPVIETIAYMDFGLHNYNDFKVAAGKTMKSILTTANVRLTPLITKEISEILSYDEMELETLGENGDRKTAIFAVCKDVDETFAFLTAMLMWQTLNLLCTKALTLPKQRLKAPVHFIFDEFANIGYMPSVDKMIAVVRSRQIFLTLIVQDIMQFDENYSRENRSTFLNNCDTHLILGVNDKDTAKDLSEGFGQGTFHTKTFNRTKGQNGSTSENNGSHARSIMTLDEVKRLDRGKCIVEIANTSPYIDGKFDLCSHPNYNEIDDGQGSYKYADKGEFVYTDYLDKYRKEWSKKRIEWCTANVGMPTSEITEIQDLPYIESNWSSK